MKKKTRVAILFLLAVFTATAVSAQIATNAREANSKPGDSKGADSTSASSDDVKLAGEHYDSGIVFYESGKLDQAIGAFKQAAKSAPDNAQTHYMLGMAYSKSKAFKEAADSFKRATQLRSDWPEAHFRFGIMSYVLGKRSQSVQEYNKLIKLNSPLANTLYRIIKEDSDPSGRVASAIPDKEPSSVKETQIADSSAPAKEVSNRVVRESSPAPVGSMVSTTATASPSPIRDSDSDAGISRSTSDDAALAEIYRIGVGDVLDIRLLNSSTSRSTLYTVVDGGMIDLPIAGGPIAVAGMTADEIQNRIALELKRRAVEEGTRVSVGVRHYASHGVVITGLVNNAGTKFLRRETVPLYVIMAEAQARPDAGRIAIMRAGSAGPSMDLSDQATLNTMIRPGDTISVTARPQEFYYIAGRINYPGQKTFQPGITLLQAILAAGGTNRKNTKKIELSRKGPDGLLTTTKFSVKDIKAGKIHDPKLQPDDLIDVVP